MDNNLVQYHVTVDVCGYRDIYLEVPKSWDYDKIKKYISEEMDDHDKYVLSDDIDQTSFQNDYTDIRIELN